MCFCAALLNAQPMGFYAPAQIVRDAREHGVEVRPVGVNASRLGLHAGAARRRPLRGAPRPAHGARPRREGRAAASSPRAADAAFRLDVELWRRAGVPVAALVQLAEADAFRSLGLARREAPWAIKALRDEPLPLFAAADRREAQFKPEFSEPTVTLVAHDGRRARSSRTIATWADAARASGRFPARASWTHRASFACCRR